MKEYDGIIKESKTDNDIMEAYLPNLYETSHAAHLLQLDNGDILCAWFSGSGEGSPDTNIVVSRLSKDSNQWTNPIDLSNDSENSEQNPVLFQAPSGVVWLFHTSGLPNRLDLSKICLLKSEDRGYTWSKPEVLIKKEGVFTKQPIAVMENGDWILPIYYWDDEGHYSTVLISSDAGVSWQEYVVDGSRHRVQMNVVQLGGSKLIAFFRSRYADRIYSCISIDFGRTWTKPSKTELPNNNSSTQTVRLKNGNLVMVYNDVTLERDQIRPFIKNGKLTKKLLRTPLTVALSEDEGKTWPYVRNIQVSDGEYFENQMGYSYPSVIQDEKGKIHIAYTYLRYGIKHVMLDEKWIKNTDRERFA